MFFFTKSKECMASENMPLYGKAPLSPSAIFYPPRTHTTLLCRLSSLPRATLPPPTHTSLPGNRDALMFVLLRALYCAN